MKDIGLLMIMPVEVVTRRGILAGMKLYTGLGPRMRNMVPIVIIPLYPALVLRFCMP